MGSLVRLGAFLGALLGGWLLLVRGALTVDLQLGRRIRPLGPLRARIEAPPQVVYDVIACPYLGTTPRAMASKLRVLERGADVVLAEHYTESGNGMTTTTLETVRFEEPCRIHFRLVRGPVPHVVETFELNDAGDGATEFVYTGELGTDLWALGSWWGERVAESWERAVATSIEAFKEEAERRAG